MYEGGHMKEVAPTAVVQLLGTDKANICLEGSVGSFGFTYTTIFDCMIFVIKYNCKSNEFGQGIPPILASIIAHLI